MKEDQRGENAKKATQASISISVLLKTGRRRRRRRKEKNHPPQYKKKQRIVRKKGTFNLTRGYREETLMVSFARRVFQKSSSIKTFISERRRVC